MSSKVQVAKAFAVILVKCEITPEQYQAGLKVLQGS